MFSSLHFLLYFPTDSQEKKHIFKNFLSGFLAFENFFLFSFAVLGIEPAWAKQALYHQAISPALKYSFWKDCSSRTILTTIAKKEQIIVCRMLSSQSLLERNRAAVEALPTHAQTQRKWFRIMGLWSLRAGRYPWQHLVPSLHFTDEMKTR